MPDTKEALKKHKWLLSEGLPFLVLFIESEIEVAQLFPTLCDPMDYSLQVPPSMGFSRQEYWSGLPFPSLGGLPNSGIEPKSPSL